MKILKRELKRIVREELKSVLLERNPYHKGEGSKGGQFTSKDKAKVYSLSNRNKGKTNHEVPLRGKVTAAGKVTSPIGMNTSKSCGKIEMPSGRTKWSGVSCSEYSKRYDEALQVVEEVANELVHSLTEGQECNACLDQFMARLKKTNAIVKNALDGKVDEHSTYAGEKVSPGDRKTPTRRSSDRRRKMKTQAGMNFPKSGFSPDELKLTRADSLWQ